jgi:transcriptional regulator with XRE-family HTH domain
VKKFVGKLNFGRRLCQIREFQGLIQSDLALKAGFQPSAISHFESGRRSPSLENLKRLADALSVTIDYLLGRETESKSAGPLIEELSRNFEQMSWYDQQLLVEIAEVMAIRWRRTKEENNAQIGRQTGTSTNGPD